MKRILALILLVTCIIPFAACSSGNDAAETTASTTAAEVESTEPAETEDPRLWPDVPDIDWEGRTFNVLGRRHDTYWYYINAEIFSEGENGETVNDAVYQRNRDIEEKYNAKITQDLQLIPQDVIKTTVAAGEQTYDMAFQNQLYVAPVAEGGYLVDMYSLEYIDFSKPWWNQELNDRISIGNKLYFTTSDFAIMDKYRTSIIFFNRDMAEEYHAASRPISCSLP